MPASARVLTLLLVSSFLIGCSGVMVSPSQQTAPQSSPVPEVLYVQNDLDPQLFAFRVNETDGSLTPISGSPFPIPTNIGRLTATIDGKFLLAARFGEIAPEPVGLYAIRVQPDGSLPTVPDEPSLPGVLSTVSVQPGVIYAVEAPGQITERLFDPETGSFSDPVNETPCLPHIAQFECDGWMSEASPDGNSFWLNGTTCDRDGCTATLTAVPLRNGTVAFPATDRAAFSGQFSEPVVLNSGVISVASNAVVGLYSADGQLVSSCDEMQSPACAQAWSVASDPQRKFLFIGTRDGKLSSVPLSAEGFSPQDLKVVNAGVRPDNIVVNSTGNFLYVLDHLSNSVTGYSIAEDGSLSPVAGARFDVSGPNAGSSGFFGPEAVIVKVPTL